MMEQNEKLKETEKKYVAIREQIKTHTISKIYRFPVLLVGPRGVGKTSLVRQWFAPWDNVARIERSYHYTRWEVPIYASAIDDPHQDTRPSMMDPSISVRSTTNLFLSVHDFPGELESQKKAEQVLKQETEELRRITGKNLGVVLICFFDATEGHTGISSETKEYYNGELFQNLRNLVGLGHASLDKLIFVFNKFDLLDALYDRKVTSDELLVGCRHEFKNLLELAQQACNPQRVSFVPACLGGESLDRDERGACVIRGLASRTFVEIVAGVDALTAVSSKTS